MGSNAGQPEVRGGMIQGYSFGKIVVDGTEYTADVLVFPERVVANWWRKEGHLLQLEDLREVLADHPEVLIVGTGSQQCLKVSEEVAAHARSIGVELMAFDTRTACRTFNDLLGRRRAVAALHLTC